VDRLDLTVPAEPDSLAVIRHALQHVVRGLALDEQRAFALTIAVGEAVNNVIEHAYVIAAGQVSVQARRDGTMLRVEVADRGRWRPVRPQSEGGRGLIVMRALVDAVDVESTDTGTTVRLAVFLAAPPAPADAPHDHAPAAPRTSAATVTALDGPAPLLPDGQFPTRVSGSTCVVEAGGEVDMRTAVRFTAALEHAAAQVPGPLIVSLTRATYLDSHGVAALFHAAARLRTNRRALFLVVAPDSPLRNLLNAVDLTTLCPVFESVDVALSAVSEPAT
jgi:anti-anti-sigma factor